MGFFLSMVDLAQSLARDLCDLQMLLSDFPCVELLACHNMPVEPGAKASDEDALRARSAHGDLPE